MPATSTASQKTFMQYLQSLSWEEVINLLMESDPYYNVPGLLAAREEQEKEQPERATASFLARAAGACRSYLRTSSKTRLLVHGLVAGYLAYAVYHGHTTPVPCQLGPDMPATARAPPSSSFLSSLLSKTRQVVGAAVHRCQLRDFSVTAAADGCNLYESSEGMQLVTRRGPSGAADLHHLFGLVMVPLAIMQKESLFGMSRRYSKLPPPSPPSEKKRDSGRLVRLWRTAHGKCGGMHILSTLCMSGLGFALGKKLQSSPVYFLRGFVAPFLVLVPMVVIPTKVPQAKFFHAVNGTVLIQASLAVPLARTLGAQVQRVLQYRLPLPAAAEAGAAPLRVSYRRAGELEGSYYFSIGLTTVVVGAWAVRDLYHILSHAHQAYMKSLQEQQQQQKQKQQQ